jgi:hypothetical protein
MMFDERWSADITEVAATLRSLLADKCDESVVRATEQSDVGWSVDVDAHLREFGLYELPADAELLAAVAFELGRALAPVPWPETASVFAIVGASDTAYALDTAAPFGPSQAVVRVGPRSAVVPLVGSRDRTGAGDVLVKVELGDVVPMYSEGQTRQLASMMRLLGAGRIIGASARLLEIGIDYAKERHAFGRPIGSYQAVSHKLADAAIAVEGAELLLKKTAYVAQREGEDAAPSPIFAAMVWSNAVDTGRLVARSVHQCMGGFGATLDYSAQLYSRRVRSWSLRLGRPGNGYREVGRQVLDRLHRDEIRGLWHEDRGINVPRWVRDIDVPSKRSS